MTNLQTLSTEPTLEARETLKSWICELTSFQPDQVDSLIEQMEDQQLTESNPSHC